MSRRTTCAGCMSRTLGQDACGLSFLGGKFLRTTFSSVSQKIYIRIYCAFRVAVYYIFSGVVLGYAYLRISRGLESTYETRKSCVLNHLNVLVAYVGYALLLMLLYTLYLVAEAQEGDSNSVGNDSPAKTLEYILSLLIGCRLSMKCSILLFLS